MPVDSIHAFDQVVEHDVNGPERGLKSIADAQDSAGSDGVDLAHAKFETTLVSRGCYRCIDAGQFGGVNGLQHVIRR